MTSRLAAGDALDQPMRIAVIGTRGVPSAYSGLETVTERLYAILADRGHQVTVYCRSGTVLGEDGAYRGIRQVRIPAFPRRSVETLSHVGASLAHAMLRGEYDLVHLQALAPGLFAPLKNLWRTATVSTIHGLDWQRAKWKGLGGSVLHRAERSLVRHVDDIAVVSRDLERYFRETYGKPTTYIPNGVNETAPDFHAGEAILTRFGVARGRYLVYVGRLVPEKRVEDLIRGFRRVKTDCKLLLVGEGGYTDDYVTALQSLAADDHRVQFAGRQEGEVLEALFSNAAMFVLPSELEGLPSALLEAMEFGVAAVVSDIPPHRELLGQTPGYDLFFPPKNTDALVARIERVLANPDAYRAVALRAQEFVRREFSWGAIADRTERFYRDAVRRAGARTRTRGVGTTEMWLRRDGKS